MSNTKILAMERDGHTCQKCGTCVKLDVHHMTAKKYGGNDDLDNLVTLCEVCHKFAPEGGTQGIKGSIDRSRLPRELCEDICKAVEHSILI